MLGIWPPAIRQLLEKPAEEIDASLQIEPAELSAEQIALRKDMLLGHLLRLTASKESPGHAPALRSHALPGIASELAAEGLIPK